MTYFMNLRKLYLNVHKLAEVPFLLDFFALILGVQLDKV